MIRVYQPSTKGDESGFNIPLVFDFLSDIYDYTWLEGGKILKVYELPNPRQISNNWQGILMG